MPQKNEEKGTAHENRTNDTGNARPRWVLLGACYCAPVAIRCLGGCGVPASPCWFLMALLERIPTGANSRADICGFSTRLGWPVTKEPVLRIEGRTSLVTQSWKALACVLSDRITAL